MRLLGIDGCRTGWVIAASDPGLHALEFSIVQDLRAPVRSARAGRALIAIDVPIGLARSTPRACDVDARRFLRAPRASSVFPAPSRAALGAASYAEACARSLHACGRRLSRQLYGILGKISEVDRLLTPAVQSRVREVHPEVTFAVLAGRNRGLARSKKTPAGESERLVILMRMAPAFDPESVRRRLGVAAVARNDIIDAVACLITASRIHDRTALEFPRVAAPERDPRGLRMEIVA